MQHCTCISNLVHFPYSLIEGFHERTEHLCKFFFSTHHSMVFYFRCSVYCFSFNYSFNILSECLHILIDCSQPSITCCLVLPPEILMHDIQCVVLGRKNWTTHYILPCHWLCEWFSHFHSCGTYSVLSQSLSIKFQHSFLINLPHFNSVGWVTRGKAKTTLVITVSIPRWPR